VGTKEQIQSVMLPLYPPFRNVKFVPNTATDTGVCFEANATAPGTFCGFASKLLS